MFETYLNVSIPISNKNAEDERKGQEEGYV
jgi:hypothetical protein